MNTPPLSTTKKDNYIAQNPKLIAAGFKLLLLTTVVASVFCPTAKAADFEFNKDHTTLTKFGGDGFPAINWAMVGYQNPIDSKKFEVQTEGVTFGSNRRIAGVFLHRIDNAIITNNEFTLDIDPSSPINSSFLGISVNASNNLSLKGNRLTAEGNNAKGFTSSSSHLHLIHIEPSKEITEMVETSPGHFTSVPVEPAYGSNEACVDDNHMFINNLVLDGDASVVSATKVGGEIKNNTLTITNSSIKLVQGISGSSQVSTGSQDEALDVINNHTIAKNSSFTRIFGVEVTGSTHFGKVSQNSLELTDVDITRKYEAIKVLGQSIGDDFINEVPEVYATADFGKLTISGKFTVDNGNGGEIGGTSNHVAGVANSSLIIQSAEVSIGRSGASLFGGSADRENAVSNSVVVSQSSISSNAEIFGGRATNGIADSNSVTIEGSTVAAQAIFGAYGAEKAINTSVLINNSTVSGLIALFDGDSKTLTEGSGTLTLGGNSNLSSAKVMPYTVSGFKGSSNTTLVLDGYSGSVSQIGFIPNDYDEKKAGAFDHVIFKNQQWSTEGALLSIQNATGSVFSQASFDNDSLSFINANDIQKGDTITLVNYEPSKNGIDHIMYIDGEQNFSKQIKSSAGTALEFSGKVTFGADSITYSVTDIEGAEQTVLVGDSRLASAVFVNQSSDLLERVFHGFTLSREHYGLMTFATAEGSKGDYDLSNPIKVNGWNFLAGVRSVGSTPYGDLTGALFVEYGEGNYRTQNSHLGFDFRTDGSIEYIGAGLAVRLLQPNAVYAEGSIRAGNLESNLDRALMDGNGNFYDADSKSLYAGLHLGMGFIMNPSSTVEIDNYAKYFFTYTDSDTFNISNLGETYKFDSIKSHRFRLGSRTSWKEENVIFMFGLAGEYEFDGKSDMIAANAPTQTSDLSGFSAFAEVGLSLRPSLTSPWQFDAQIRAWEGTRDAVSGMATINYLF